MDNLDSLDTATNPARSGGPAALPDDDLFLAGRQALQLARQRNGNRGIFARVRQRLVSGAWRGPRDAADSYVEEVDLGAEGLSIAREQGVRTLITLGASALAREASATPLRLLCRITYIFGEPAEERLVRLQRLTDAMQVGLRVDGVIPTPQGEPLGLDTLRFFAQCRIHLPVPHLLVDFARLGHRLAQMALGFGADELLGPIAAERALRLGANANNPALTRKEAALLIRGAGLVPYERLSGGELEEFIA